MDGGDGLDFHCRLGSAPVCPLTWLLRQCRQRGSSGRVRMVAPALGARHKAVSAVRAKPRKRTARYPCPRTPSGLTCNSIGFWVQIPGRPRMHVIIIVIMCHAAALEREALTDTCHAMDVPQGAAWKMIVHPKHAPATLGGGRGSSTTRTSTI